MVLLNQQQLLGSIIPDAYLTKVTLETAGDILLNSNPHVDHEREPNIEKDPRTGKIKRKNISPNYANKPYSGSPLKVTLDFLVKEVIDDSLIGRWFGNEDFEKYIRIKVYQITNKELADIGKSDKRLLSSLDRLITKSALVPRKNPLSKLIASKLETPEMKKIVERGLQTKTLSIKDFQGDKNDYQKHHTEIDASGNQITNFAFRTTFHLPNSNPEYLSYFVFSYLDISQMATDLNLSLKTNDLIDPVGKIVAETIIEDHQVVDRSFIYLDASGKIWTGPIVKSGNRLVAKTNNGEQIDLIKKEVKNSKIQDFRNFEDIERLTLDFSITENELAEQYLTTYKKERFGDKIPASYFSQMGLSRDRDGQARFMFGIDLRKILEQNSIAGSVFKKQNNISSAIKDARIVSMKVSRVRIGGSSETGSEPIPDQKFDEQQVEEFFVASGEQTYDAFREINNNKASLREIRGVVLDDAGVAVRHFTGIDKEMALITDGYYRYKVDLKVLDPGPNFLERQQDRLRAAVKMLQDYYAKATSLAASSQEIAFSNPHIDHPRERTQSGEVLQGNFDPFVNRFTDKFITEMRNRYGLRGTGSPWLDAVNTYLDVLQLFSKDKIDEEKIKNSLLHFVHPATGNPTGISKLIDLIETLQTNISVAAGMNDVNRLRGSIWDSSATWRTTNGSFEPLKVIEVSCMFNSIVDSGLDSKSGYDYLDLEVNDKQNGLKELSGKEFALRVERETDKYYVRPEGIPPDISLKDRDLVYTQNDKLDNTSWSYLTPARYTLSGRFDIVRMGKSPVPKNTSTSLAAADAAVRRGNTTTLNYNPPVNNNTSHLQGFEVQSTINDLVSMFNDLGVDVEVSTTISIKPPTDLVLSSPRSTEPFDPIVEENKECDTSKGNNPNVNPIPVLTQVIKRMTPEKIDGLAGKIKKFNTTKPLKDKRVSISSFDITSKDSKLSRLIEDPTKIHSESFFHGTPHTTTLEDAIKALPNQVKSLYLARTRPDIVRKDWFGTATDPVLSYADEAEFRLDFKMISVVKVLKGYKKDQNGAIMIKEPIWMPLTLDIFNAAVGKALLCRFDPYENKLIGIERDLGAELPVYDQYFILKPRQQAAKNIKKVLPPPVIALDPFAPQTIENVSADDLQRELNINNAVQFAVRTEYMATDVVEDVYDPNLDPTRYV